MQTVYAVQNVTMGIDQQLQITGIVKDNNGGQRAFEAFTTSNDKTDYGYQAYIPTEYMNPDSVDVSIVIKNGSEYLKTATKTADIQQADI